MMARVEFNAQGSIMFQIYLDCPGNQLRDSGIPGFSFTTLLAGFLSLNLRFKSGKIRESNFRELSCNNTAFALQTLRNLNSQGLFQYSNAALGAM